MRVFFVASLGLALCATTFAQTQRTCPPGFKNKEGSHFSDMLGKYADARQQFADGGCRGTPISIKQIDYRLNQEYYSGNEGPGRTWTNVTLNLALTDVSKMSQTFSANILSSPTTVFSSPVTWKTVTNQNPFPTTPQLAKWGDVASFVFSTPYFYIANKDLLFDYTFRGGKMANAANWSGSTSGRYKFDSVAGTDLNYSRNQGLGWGNFWCPPNSRPCPGLNPRPPGSPIGCTDSGQTASAWAAIEVDVYSNNPPNPTRVHSNYLGRGNKTYAQLKGMFDIELSSLLTAKSGNVIHAMGVAGTLTGVNIGAKCNLLFIDTTKPWIPILRTADSSGHIGFASNTVRSTLLGPAPFNSAFAGFRAWHQAAYADSKTGAFTLTTARFADIPNPPVALSKAMVYATSPSVPLGQPVSRSSFQQTLPLLTSK